MAAMPRVAVDSGCGLRSPQQPFKPSLRPQRLHSLRSSILSPARAVPSHQQLHTPLQVAGELLLAGCLTILAPNAALAADTAKVGTCLLQSCQTALASCIADPGCVQNLACLQACNGQPDETACQIRCGDLYEDKAVDAFNSCAVSDKKCVPQRVDKGVFPVPPPCALDSAFSLADFQGRWYITSGLNKLFDTFDCQEHYFASPSEGTLVGKIRWRIPVSKGDFIERSTMQRFVQDKDDPAKLFNHGNEYLHYEDDWYILSSKPDKYVFIYYRGNNDAWKGYGGATVYTRESKLPQEYVPELRAAAERAGLDWSQFEETDNTCKPHPPARPLRAEVKEDLEGGLKSFGRGFTVLENTVVSTIGKEEVVVEKEIKADLAKAESMIEGFEREVGTELSEEEARLAADVEQAENFVLQGLRKLFGQ